MASKIQILRSTGSSAASGLAPGELAYTEGLETLYIGSPTDTDSNGVSDSMLVIGGKAYTDMVIPETASNAASIILKEDTSNGAHGITIKAPDSVAADVTLTLPGDDGTANQLLTTNGSGVLTWDDTLSVASVNVSGNLTVSGTTTTVDSTVVTVADPVFQIGASAADDNKDRGILFAYNSSGAKIGFFGMDDSDKRFKYWAVATNTSEVMSGTLGDAQFTNIYGTLATASQTNITGVGTITTGVWNGTAIANANLANSTIGVTAGNGLSGGGTPALGASTSLALDLNELTAATVAVANDSIAIIDAGDSSSKKESIADLVGAIAGAGLTATAGVLSADQVGDVDLASEVTGTLPVANGGTGATTLTNGGILLGSGTGAVTAMAVLADSAMIVGDGTTDPVAETGATLRASIGVSIGSQVQAYSAGLQSISGLTEVAGSVIYTTADNTYAALAAGTAGELLQSNGASAPTWATIDGGSY
jgi:hypothetical protein